MEPDKKCEHGYTTCTALAICKACNHRRCGHCIDGDCFIALDETKVKVGDTVYFDEFEKGRTVVKSGTIVGEIGDEFFTVKERSGAQIAVEKKAVRDKESRVKIEKTNMSWETVERLLWNILNQVPKFDGVVGIKRGGLILALWVSQVMDVPCGEYEPATGTLFMPGFVSDCEKILVIDDIEDSSETLEKFNKRFLKEFPNIAVLVQKEKSQKLAKWVGAGGITIDDWIVFPWERCLVMEKKGTERDGT